MTSEEPGRSTPRTRVIYVAGAHRAGSTLLASMLGQVRGLCSVGELVHVWDVAAGDRRCGCGRPLKACPFWGEVASAAFGGWEAAPVDRMLRLQRDVDRIRHLPRVLVPSGPAFLRRMRAYAGSLERLYRAIAEISSCRAVVDSSKRPATAWLLHRSSSVDLRLVHLVRDSRGVAHSLSRPPRAQPPPGEEPLPRFHPARAAVQWIVDNLLVEALRRRVPSVLLTYEALVREPRAAIERVLAALDAPPGPGDLDFIEASGLRLAPTHSADGNPGRFASGGLAISEDARWRAEMPARHRLAVTALTWPLLARYGYGRGPRGRVRAGSLRGPC